MEDRPNVSVVIPVYNEAPNLREVCERTVSTLEAMGRTFEIVAVDDGSRDSSVATLEELRQNDPRLRIVVLARNFGQTPALYAGFANARGDVVVTLDADLQNPPEEMARLLEKLDEGYDVVQGWRLERQDSVWRKLPSKLLNATVSRLMGAKIRDLGCGLKALRREVVERMVEFSHHARYVPAEIVWLGVKIAEVPVKHQERAQGASKYGLLTLLRLNFDMITSISTMPIKIIGWIGWLFSLAGFVIGARIALMRIWYGHYSDLATVTALFFFLAGVQLIATGVMCEYIGRIFVEVQHKPYYVVKKVIE